MPRKLLFVVSLATIAAMLLAACGATPTPTKVPPTATKAAAPAAPAAPTATKAPAAPAPAEDYSKAVRKDTVIFDIDGGRVVAPDNWHPYLPSGSRRDQGYHQAMLEPIQILNYETGQITPWLAESFTSNAGLDVWTLKLKKGITWSDGKPMTADDVEFTVNMVWKNDGFQYNAAMKQWLKSLRKVDDLTTEFTLTGPNPRFALDYFSTKLWGSLSPLPKHIWEGQDPLTFKFYDKAKGWPVLSGPYKLSTIGETEFSYVRNDNWWAYKTGFQGLPKPKLLIWMWGGPEETRVALMADGKLDSLMDITKGAYLALKAKNPKAVAWWDKEPYSALDPCARNLELNTAQAPWDDKEMRWALNYVVNRDQVVQVAYEATTIKSMSIFPDYAGMRKYTDLIPKDIINKLWTTDAKKAEEILTKKGYVKRGAYWQKDGKDLALEIKTHEAFIELQRMADVIVEQLQKFGINATTKKQAGGVWGDNGAFGNFEASSGWQACGSVNEPWGSMNNFNASFVRPKGERAPGNIWRWKNEEYTKLVDEIGKLPLGDPKINDLFVKAMTIWYDELPILPIAQARKLTPFDTTYWKNWPTSSNNYFMPWTWWGNGVMYLTKIEPAQ